MTNCKLKTLEFGKVKNRIVQANFEGGNISSDAGVLLLKEIDEKLGLIEKVNKVIPDNRHQSYVLHQQISSLRQRIYAIATGYEDVNDHSFLRNDLLFQTAVNEDKSLASASTLSRLENSLTRKEYIEIHKIFFKQFIHSFDSEPDEIILDFDATDDIVHGNQKGAHYHGYYKNDCFLPLYVFSGEQLLVAYLRPGNIDAAKHASLIFKLLTNAIRKEFPKTKIIFRGDGGFCKHKLFDWIEKQENVYYITGIAGNKRLQSIVKEEIEIAKAKFEETKEKQRYFMEFEYSAKSWSKDRRIIAKIEVTTKGENPRFIVTNIPIEIAEELYDEYYCQRGEMENRIKEQQLYLFADRTSCEDFGANQFRLILSSLAYVLLERMRNLVLKGTELAKATVNTIRLKLLKIGAVIVRNTRRVKVYLSSNYRYKELFERIHERLKSG